MSQHDLTIDNQGFPAFRADLNNALQALGSTQSGNSAPSPTFANQLWYDTTNNQLKIRNEDNDAWIVLATLDQTGDVTSGVGAKTLPAGDIVGTSDTQTLTNKTINASQLVDNSVTPAKLSSTAQYTGYKNRIINGAMVIDQRNAGASVTPTASAYTLDRWQANISQASKISIQRNAGSVTPPTGFTNYLGVTSLAATSLGAGDFYIIQQAIEGFNTADLDFGKATAKTITISFWVRSSLTGTFGGAIANDGATRSYPFTYTISAANTWEQKSVTIAGDTSGTWVGATNGLGIIVYFGLGVGTTYSGTAGAWASANYGSATGATSVVGTNGATFYITGVQLEVGSTATSFDYRPYTTELQLCQRYYAKISSTVSNGAVGSGLSRSSTATNVYIKLPVSMRTIPTVSYNTAYINYASDVYTAVDGNSGVQGGTDAINYFPNSSTATIGGNGFAVILAIGQGGYVDFTSEL